MNKPLIDVLQGRPNSHLPVWLMRQAGRYLPEYREIRARAVNFLDLCYAPALAAEVTLQPIRRFGFDAAILFADILLIPHALGQKLRFAEGEGPLLEAVKGSGDLARLRPEVVLGRLSPVFETVSRVKAALPEKTALIGFAGAPWTVATYMVEGRGSSDQRAAKLWALRDPEGFQHLIDLLSDVTVDYLLAQVAAGAEVIQLFESWAGSLDTAGFVRWSLAPTRRIVARIKAAHPTLPVIGFPRGAGPKIVDYPVETGVDAISLDWGIPLSWAVKELPQKTVLQGNLDPLALLAGGEALREATDEILSAAPQGRFIFNLGHGILPETPIAHVEDLLARIRGRTT